MFVICLFVTELTLVTFVWGKLISNCLVLENFLCKLRSMRPTVPC